MQTTDKTPDGRIIIAREPATGPHPHPRLNGKIITYNGVSQLLLEDEKSVFECDVCGRVHENFRYIFGHMSSHSRRRGTVYDEKTLRAVATAVRRHRGKKKFCELAANELNERGFTSASGKPWNAQNVSSVFNKYCTDIRVHIRRDKSAEEQTPLKTAHEPLHLPSEVGSSKREPRTDLEVASRHVVTAFNAMQDAINEFQRVFLGYMRLAATSAVPTAPDPELVAKAEKWDKYLEFQSFINAPTLNGAAKATQTR